MSKASPQTLSSTCHRQALHRRLLGDAFGWFIMPSIMAATTSARQPSPLSDRLGSSPILS